MSTTDPPCLQTSDLFPGWIGNIHTDWRGIGQRMEHLGFKVIRSTFAFPTSGTTCRRGSSSLKTSTRSKQELMLPGRINRRSSPLKHQATRMTKSGSERLSKFVNLKYNDYYYLLLLWIQLKFLPYILCASTEPTAILSKVNHHITTSQISNFLNFCFRVLEICDVFYVMVHFA